AAPPVLIADSEVCNLPGAGVPVASSFGRQRGRFVGGQVLQPLRHFARGSRTQIAVDVGIRTDQLSELQKLVCAESVAFGNSAPVRVEGHRSRRARAD